MLHILSRTWSLLIAAPLVNLVLIVAFWQSQIAHYAHSTQGIVYSWLVAGLIFVFIQMSLQGSALRHAIETRKSPTRQETIWSLSVQLILFLIMATYNTVVLVELWLVGVRPDKLFDLLIGFVVLATIIFIVAKYRRTIKNPDARLLLATGTKAVPQWLQACSLALVGSSGMHILTISAIAGMGTLRYLLTRHAAKVLPSANTMAADKAALRDLISIGGMCLGWIIGIGR